MVTLGKVYPVNNVAVIGNYLPRQCGIATFTTDLCDALAAEMGTPDGVDTLAMDDIPEGYTYPDRVKFQITAKQKSDYRSAADFINVNQYDAVILQHEYGIFGGRDGAFILRLLRGLHMPIITTLHTVLTDPTKGQKEVMSALGDVSDRLVVMSHKAHQILDDVYDIPKEKVVHIPHGIPDVPFGDPSFNKDLFDVEENKVILTFGLLGPSKGIETMIQAMPAIIKEHPDAVYLVLGATHPHIIREFGEEYRHSLYEMVSSLGLEDHVFFHNRFVSLDVLCQYISCADVYCTPYPNPAQITSGTLAYAAGSGKAVVSTPYWYAEELLADERGVLVPFGDSDAMGSEISALLGDDVARNALRKRMYQYCRPMAWKEVARSYLELAGSLVKTRARAPRPVFTKERMLRTREELPEPSFEHLKIMTDGTGIFQHAHYTIPDRNHGYCVDDNARALIVTCTGYANNPDETLLPLMYTYLSFLHYSLNPETKRFRNFMGYDRRWLEDVGSEDSQGRSLWGLGVAVKYAPTPSIRHMATRLFADALHVAESFDAPRAMSFALVGIHAYLEVYGGDSDARRMRLVLAEKIYNLFSKNVSEEWPWFENEVTYANAKIPQALILAGQWIPNAKMFDAGVRALRWLLTVQTAGDDGHLSVIGNDGWYAKGKEKASFDQQAIEAMNLVEACVEVFRSTGEREWLVEARRCLAWFLGRNDLETRLVDFKTGGCHDGLQPHGVNANQGAESTLAWLIALLSLHEIVGQNTDLAAGDEATTVSFVPDTPASALTPVSLSESVVETKPEPAAPAAAPSDRKKPKRAKE